MFTNQYIVRTNVQTSLFSFTCPLKLVLSLNTGDDFLPEMVANRFMQGIKSSETWGSSVWEMTGYGAYDEDTFIIGERDTLFATPTSSLYGPPTSFQIWMLPPNKIQQSQCKINYSLPPTAKVQNACSFTSRPSCRYSNSNISLKANLYNMNHTDALESRNASK